MLSAERLMWREARPHATWPVYQAARTPPFVPAAAGGLSGRPRCRIFPVGRLWVLQMETASAWFAGDRPSEPPPRLKFPTLAAAVAHAEWHGYDYRIIQPGPVAQLPVDRHRLAPPERRLRNGSESGGKSTEH